MKKQSNLSSLMGYAGGYRILTYLSWILSVMSALLALVPFWYIWRITTYWKFLQTSHGLKRSQVTAGLPYYLRLFLLLFI